jgi:hypothetical protein
VIYYAKMRLLTSAAIAGGTFPTPLGSKVLGWRHRVKDSAGADEAQQHDAEKGRLDMSSA